MMQRIHDGMHVCSLRARAGPPPSPRHAHLLGLPLLAIVPNVLDLLAQRVHAHRQGACLQIAGTGRGGGP